MCPEFQTHSSIPLPRGRCTVLELESSQNRDAGGVDATIEMKHRAEVGHQCSIMDRI